MMAHQSCHESRDTRCSGNIIQERHSEHLQQRNQRLSSGHLTATKPHSSHCSKGGQSGAIAMSVQYNHHQGSAMAFCFTSAVWTNPVILRRELSDFASEATLCIRLALALSANPTTTTYLPNRLPRHSIQQAKESSHLEARQNDSARCTWLDVDVWRGSMLQDDGSYDSRFNDEVAWHVVTPTTPAPLGVKLRLATLAVSGAIYRVSRILAGCQLGVSLTESSTLHTPQ